MNIIATLQQKLEIGPDEMPKMEHILQQVKEVIDRNEIHFKENPEIVFYAHIVNFVRRLEAGEELSVETEEYRKEIDDVIYELAQEIVTKICDQCGSEMDPAEIILVAIHIQATLI